MSDDEQLAYVKEFLPPSMKSRIGWYCFDLIMGYGPFSRMSLLKPNCDRRPPSEFMEGVLKSA